MGAKTGKAVKPPLPSTQNDSPPRRKNGTGTPRDSAPQVPGGRRKGGGRRTEPGLFSKLKDKFL